MHAQTAQAYTHTSAGRRTELLAPAGGPEAGYAALHYGADAIYLGLKRFSARAEARNFELAELDEIVAFAHSLSPRRKVYVTLNTLVQEAEIPDAVGCLAEIAERGADAAIVQDAGMARIARRHFPSLRLHASTQMAVHDAAGVRAVRDLGFARVTLARELSLAEVRAATAEAGVEIEMFVHGALCYSYSGLCLFSSLLRGRSGNRGRCEYPCRESCRVLEGMRGAKGGSESLRREGHAFSMKDLALRRDAPALRDAGVAALKIEGRMKSPLYVASVVDYYRRLLDGRLSEAEGRERESGMQTVFARPWTKLFLRSSREQETVDVELVGHRGSPVGEALSVRRDAEGRHWLRFRTRRSLERHDGLQADLAGRRQPFGFAVTDLRTAAPARGAKTAKSVPTVPASSLVDVLLPPHHPEIPEGTRLYCSSSQAVKRAFPFPKPRPGAFGRTRDLEVTVEVSASGLCARAKLAGGGADLGVADVGGEFQPARQAGRTEEAARGAFDKLGGTGFRLAGLTCVNPDGLFVPVSVLNDLRRRVMEVAVSGQSRRQAVAVESLRETLRREADSLSEGGSADEGESWAVKVDRVGSLGEFTAEDWGGVEEAIVDVSRDAPSDLTAGLAHLEGKVGKGRIRLALPPVWRQEDGRVRALLAAGWRKWQISNVGGGEVLRRSGGASVDVSADWQVYTLNTQAALTWREAGWSGVTLSPEDDRENLAALLGRLGRRATVMVYGDAPLFLSASCVVAGLSGGCQGTKRCPPALLRLRTAGGETVRAMVERCRTVVADERPFSLVARLSELRGMGAKRFRADFLWKPYTPAEVCALWRRIRAGALREGYEGNYARGLA